jgi:hypothetical protein
MCVWMRGGREPSHTRSCVAGATKSLKGSKLDLPISPTRSCPVGQYHQRAQRMRVGVKRVSKDDGCDAERSRQIARPQLGQVDFRRSLERPRVEEGVVLSSSVQGLGSAAKERLVVSRFGWQSLGNPCGLVCCAKRNRTRSVYLAGSLLRIVVSRRLRPDRLERREGDGRLLRAVRAQPSSTTRYLS